MTTTCIRRAGTARTARLTTSRTGHKPAALPKRAQNGFTLVEIMLAAAFLSLGTLLIHESFLRSASLYGRYVNTLRAERWASEKMSAARVAALFGDKPESGRVEGVFEEGGRSYRWALNTENLSATLVLIRLDIGWSEGNRPQTLVRETYAARPQDALL